MMHKWMLLLVFCCLSLTACSSVMIMDPKSVDIFRTEKVNLAELNYGAADYLAGQTLSFLNKNMTMEIGTLKNVKTPEISSPFARLVPEQVGTRFAQLGYVVTLDEIETFEGERRLKPKKPEVIITGNYIEARQEVQVNLRLVHLKSGQVIGSFDYQIPMNREVADLLEPETRILRR